MNRAPSQLVGSSLLSDARLSTYGVILMFADRPPVSAPDSKTTSSQSADGEHLRIDNDQPIDVLDVEWRTAREMESVGVLHHHQILRRHLDGQRHGAKRCRYAATLSRILWLARLTCADASTPTIRPIEIPAQPMRTVAELNWGRPRGVTRNWAISTSADMRNASEPNHTTRRWRANKLLEKPSGAKSSRFIDCQFTENNALGEGKAHIHTRVFNTPTPASIACPGGVNVAESIKAALASHRNTGA